MQFKDRVIKGGVIAFMGSPTQSNEASPAIWDQQRYPPPDTGERTPP